jgi:predicted RNA-binding Zn-ribbon protein involved in translation (DUF1610 family)
MSLKDSDRITCTECGQPIEVTYWSTMNVTLDPDLEEQLLDGTLTKAICPKCGNEHNVIYHTLYHDMERYFMIEYSGEDEESNSRDHSADQELEETLLKYRFLRRVYSWDQMREKVIIFRDGLNDIIVELVKTMLMLHEFDMKEPQDDFMWYTGTQEGMGARC